MPELGDIIVSDTRTKTSKVIKYTTGERYGHITLLATPQLVVESDMYTNKFKLFPYDELYRTIDHYIVRPKLPKKVREKAAKKALTHIGDRYGRMSLTNIILQNSLPKILYRNSYTCSCMVNDSYDGIFGEHGFTTPWQILRSPLNELIEHNEYNR